MPELPEVETTVRGIEPYLTGKRFSNVVVRESRLRWPVPEELGTLIVGQRVVEVRRRAKYILIRVGSGHVLVHLGMSGSLRLSPTDQPPEVHDHVEIEVEGEWLLRLRDPRRFGCVLWVEGDPSRFRLLSELGLEPLGENFDGNYLYEISRKRRLAIKNLIMDGHVVVGVGNIYASEALHRAGISPNRSAHRISRERYRHLAQCIRSTIGDALNAGGTTLRDFVSGEGKPGYFAQELLVYDREGLPCKTCGTPVSRKVIGQRSTYFCIQCQT